MEDETETEETETKPETPPPAHDDSALRELINNLNTKVDELSETVAGLTAGNGDLDSTPVKRPWTHWGSN